MEMQKSLWREQSQVNSMKFLLWEHYLLFRAKEAIHPFVTIASASEPVGIITCNNHIVIVETSH
jgi:hypothetical protein